jgi:hypothetical protein
MTTTGTATKGHPMTNATNEAIDTAIKAELALRAALSASDAQLRREPRMGTLSAAIVERDNARAVAAAEYATYTAEVAHLESLNTPRTNSAAGSSNPRPFNYDRTEDEIINAEYRNG